MKKTHNIIKKYTIADGLDIVVDHKKSQGSWVHDVLTGNKLLDCYSSFASQPLGWNHPELVRHKDKLGEIALHKLACSDMYSEEYAEFIEEFATVTPDFRYYFFIDGGTLAVENALKAAFDYKMKRINELHDSVANSMDVIHLEQAFHGRSGYCLSLTNTKPIKTWGFPKFKWTRLVNPCLGEGEERRTEISLMQAEEALRGGHVAAVVVEPIQGEGGDIHFPEQYLKNLRKLAHQYDTLFIVDEVQTGMGLTGAMWAYEHFDLAPDLLCFGKKTQVCGFCSTNTINNVENNVFHQSGRINSTWGGNIVDMVRFTIISQIIKKENLLDNVREVGKYFLEKLEDCSCIGHARGRGFMLAFDLDSAKERDYYHHELGKYMLTLKSGDRSIRLRPALNFSKADVDVAMEFIEKVAKS